MQTIKFISIKEYPDYAKELIKRVGESWNETQEWVKKLINEAKNNDKLPKIIMGFFNNQMIGYFSLIDHELLKEKNEYTPWLGTLLIFPEFRKKGYSPIF